MYYIYKIAYRISDEMKAQKEAEKPFWWGNLHPEVKDKTIEEIEKELLQGDTLPDKIVEMTKYEKYLAASEGYYLAQTKDTERLRAELETLQQNAKTGFLNQTSVTPAVEESFEPIVFGQKPQTIVVPVPVVESSSFNGLNQSVPNPMDLEQPAAAANGLEMPSMEPPSPFNSPTPNQNVGGSGGGGGNEARKYAQSIVSKTINDINAKAGQIPQDISVTEAEILNAVVEELQVTQNKHSKNIN